MKRTNCLKMLFSMTSSKYWFQKTQIAFFIICFTHYYYWKIVMVLRPCYPYLLTSLSPHATFLYHFCWIYSSLPANKQIMTLSATYPESLANFITNYMRSPTIVRLNSDDLALIGSVFHYCFSFMLIFRLFTFVCDKCYLFYFIQVFRSTSP